MTSSPTESGTRDQRLHRLLECTSDGICEVDTDGRCTYSNATGARLLGYEAADLMGSVLHDAIHPSGRVLAPAECSICQAVKNAQGLKIGEAVRRTHGVLSHKNGRAIPVAYSVQAWCRPAASLTLRDRSTSYICSSRTHRAARVP